MTNIFQVQINVILSILIICLFCHAYFKMNTKTRTNRLFMWLMGLTWLAIVLEIFSVLLNVPGIQQWILWQKLVNIAGFIITPCVPFVGYMFCREWANRFQHYKDRVNTILTPTDSSVFKKAAADWEGTSFLRGSSPESLEKKRNSWLKLDHLLFLPIMVNAIGAIMSFFGGQLFRITSENVYERGPLFFILPVVSSLYFINGFLYMFFNRKKFTSAELLLFSMFSIIPTVFTIVQLQYFSYLTSWNSAAFVIIIIYVFILNDQAYRDSLTGLENRLSYEHYSQKISRKKLARICMIYIDIDYFKSINDKWGHSEGDEAIQIFADLIVDSFAIKHKKIMRFGGDEFLVVVEEEQQSVIDDCMDALSVNVNKFNNNAIKPYKLAFSHGMGRFSDEYRNMDELMDDIDHKMYVNKQAKKDLYG